MAIALTLKKFLHKNGIEFEILPHGHTNISMQTAETAHIPGDKLAKSVILKDKQDYLMAIVPSTYHVQLSDLSNQLHRDFSLVDENELSDIFSDCEVGAIPPIGNAYYVDMIVDKKLFNCEDVYIEAGDHSNLVHMNQENFKKFVQGSDISEFSQHI